MNTDNQPDHSDWVRHDHVTQSEPVGRHCGIWDGTVGKPGFSVRWGANLGRVFPGAAVFKGRACPTMEYNVRESGVESQRRILGAIASSLASSHTALRTFRVSRLTSFFGLS